MQSTNFRYFSSKIILIWSVTIMTAFDRAASNMTLTFWAGVSSTFYLDRHGTSFSNYFLGRPQTLIFSDNISIIAVNSTTDHRYPGMLASTVNSNYILTNSSWKCTNRVDDWDMSWTSYNYNDYEWRNATIVARYGFANSNFQPNASWIWTNMVIDPRTGEFKGDDVVYCRLRIGSGRLLTYIATDVSSVYFDGREQQLFGMESGDWKNGYTIQIPSDLQVIGIKSNATPSNSSTEMYYGIIAWSNDDYILTNSSWKCTNQVPDTSWTDACYDDSNWQTASKLSYQVAGVNPLAYWIWTNVSADRLVYCRLSLSTGIPECPTTSKVQTTAATTTLPNSIFPDGNNSFPTREVHLDDPDRPQSKTTSSTSMDGMNPVDQRGGQVLDIGAIIGGVVGAFGAALLIVILVVFIICCVKKRRKPVEEKTRVVSFINEYIESPSKVPTKDFQDLKRPKAETSTKGEDVNIYETIKKSNRLTLDSLQTYEHLKVLPAENDYQVLCNSSFGESNDLNSNSVNPTDAAANLDQDTKLEDDDLYTQI